MSTDQNVRAAYKLQRWIDRSFISARWIILRGKDVGRVLQRSFLEPTRRSGASQDEMIDAESAFTQRGRQLLRSGSLGSVGVHRLPQEHHPSAVCFSFRVARVFAFQYNGNRLVSVHGLSLRRILRAKSRTRFQYGSGTCAFVQVNAA